MATTTHYFDYAAATPVDARVAQAMAEAQRRAWANPSSLHTPGREAQRGLEAARARVARVLGAKPAEIIFTSGSTEATNIAIQGVAGAYARSRLVASVIEHESVQACLTGLEAAGHSVGVVTVDEEGMVTSQQVVAAIDDLTVLVCIQYVNSELGTMQPLTAIASTLAEVRADRKARGITTPLYLYCDAAQAGLLSLQVSRLGVDLMSLGGSKLYGPAGIGALYVRAGVELEPILFGGGQERGLRGGSENVPAAVGLATALELTQSGRVAEAKRQSNLRDALWQALSKLPDVRRNGSSKHSASGILNITVPGASGEELAAHLNAAGFAVATGSACSTTFGDPSHVLLAIGLSATEAEESLRISLGRPTTKREVGKLITALRAAVPRVRKHGAATH